MDQESRPLLPVSPEGTWQANAHRRYSAQSAEITATWPLLHKEKSNNGNKETVNAKCTAVCDANGGVSCRKILPVDVCSKDKPDSIHRVYAIFHEQSNSSLISSELLDKLGADGPSEKYYLSTCSQKTEVKYGRRVTGLMVRSPNGAKSELPTLVECNNIPQEIASEIPSLDSTADIHLLIGRDAPELLSQGD